MYRDGTTLVASCLVGVVLYGISLSLALPSETVAAEEEPVAAVEEVPNLISDEIGNDPSLPLSYNIERIEEVRVTEVVPGSVNPAEQVGVQERR